MSVDLKYYFALFMRRLHYFLAFVLLGSVLGITLAVILPPVYRAQAVLLVESQQIPSELAASTVETGATEQLQIIQQRILTRASLLEMANRLNIYEAQRAMPADEIVEDMRRRIEITTTGDSGRRGAVQATIVRVSFEAAKAQLSAAAANEVVTLILEENVSIRTNVAGQTLDFFEEEVTRLDRELTEISAQILAFQEQNLNALPDSLDFRRAQQSAAQERLTQLSRDEATLRDRRDGLIDLYEQTGRINPSDQAPRTPQERQLQELRDELDTMLAVLSPQNPKVKVVQARLEALEKAVAQSSSQAPAVSAQGEQLSAYEIQLADLDGQLEFISAEKQQIAARLEELQASIEATPGNAITLNRQVRNLENVRTQYDRAVANRARAETGDTIEALAKGQRISVIEQAIVPRAPVSPNRPLLAIAGIFGGLVMGLGLIIGLELLNTSIRRPVDLQKALGITPIGTISYMRTDHEQKRRVSLILAGLAGVVILVPAILWFMQTWVTGADGLF